MLLCDGSVRVALIVGSCCCFSWIQPHMRGGVRRHVVLLGRWWLWSVRKWRSRRLIDSNRCGWHQQRIRGCVRLWSHVCSDDIRWNVLLGKKRLRPAWKWCHIQCVQSARHACDVRCDRHFCRPIPHMRALHCWRRVLLGLQLQRSTGTGVC